MGYEPGGRIAPVAPAPSLLTSARKGLTNVADWRSGVAWTPVCQPSYNLVFCPPKVDRNDAEDRAEVHTTPFTIYTPQICDMPVDGADLEATVRDLSEVHTAYAIASALWMGTGLDPTDEAIPTLRRSAEDVSGGTALDLDDGVAQLLAHYEIATGGNGGAVVHLPSQLSVYALGGGAGGARLCWPEGSVYRGPLGSTFVCGPGYPNGTSATGPNGHGPGGGGSYLGNPPAKSWIYVTGPVEYDVTAVRVLPDDERDRVPFRRNTYEVWGEREAIVRFDPCSSFATEVINPAPLAELS